MALWVVKMVRAGLDRMVASDRSVPVVVGSRTGEAWEGVDRSVVVVRTGKEGEG